MKRVVILLVLLQVAALNANPLETMPEEIEVAELNANPLWNQTLPEELDSDEYEIHGDMIVKKTKNTRSVGLSTLNSRWPNGVVPYEIDPAAAYSQAQIDLILFSMNEMTTKTGGCITFVPRTSLHRNWITIRNGAGCNSFLGMLARGSQTVNLSKRGCLSRSTIVHEFMHAIGFHHEQTRNDRDDFVTINFQNIQDNVVSNFNKFTSGQFFGTPYDIDSVMQYDEMAFSKNGQPTIVPKNGQAIITDGERERWDMVMTHSDISAVRSFYQCTTGVTPAPVVKPATSKLSSYSFSLTNDLASSVQVFWVNFDKKEQLFYTIRPGQQITQTGTHKDHEWVVRGNNYARRFFIGEEEFVGQRTVITLLNLKGSSFVKA